MTFVRTVLGDIPPGSLGRCYAHEHLVIERSYVTQVFPEIHLPSAENAVRELTDVRKAGGGAMVETMPCDAGRNVLKLAEISRRSGVQVIAPTGLHVPRFYPEGHWRFRLGVEHLTDLFVGEIEEGIDAHDCAGPTVSRTTHQAGVIKLGSATPGLDDAERTAFAAGAEAHRRTGCPVITHVEPGPRHLTLSHTDRTLDRGYHRALLRTGVFLEYDRMLRGPLDAGNPTLRLAADLVPEFPGQIMLGNDGARATLWRSYGGSPGLDWLLTGFCDLLRAAGLTEAHLASVLVDNPARAFAFRR
ncbi:MAG: aryldialkylphosphatase [Acidobacteria bacterium]|nr:MAG: aryldialkylphosphatase [Acidobacteriota bacterium]